MSIVSRRSFTKFVGMVIGSIAVPNIVKTVAAPLFETEIEDVDDIIDGLVRRFRTVRVTKEEAELVSKFFSKIKEWDYEAERAFHKEYIILITNFGEDHPTTRAFVRKHCNPIVRFWSEFVNASPYPGTDFDARDRNIENTKNFIVPHVLRNFFSKKSKGGAKTANA